MQDTPAGEVPSKYLSAFPSLASALSQPWKTMRARYTHKLVFVLRGRLPHTSHCGGSKYKYCTEAYQICGSSEVENVILIVMW